LLDGVRGLQHSKAGLRGQKYNKGWRQQGFAGSEQRHPPEDFLDV
jgi:hypothetical protein